MINKFLTELTEHKWEIFTVSLAIAVLGFSMFASIYSNFSHNVIIADTNAQSYALQADITSNGEDGTYQKIEEEWLDVSKVFRHYAKLRAYSAIWCALGLWVFLFTFIFLFKKRPYWLWLIPFGISIVLLIMAFATYIYSWEFSWLNKAPHILRGGVTPEL